MQYYISLLLRNMYLTKNYFNELETIYIILFYYIFFFI